MDIHINVRQGYSYAKMKLNSNSTRLEISRHDWDEARQGPCELTTFDDYSYGRIFEAIMRKPLQTISIERSHANDEDFIDFLRIPRGSLRALKIHQFRIFVVDLVDMTWRFIRFLRDELDLTYLSLGDFVVESLYGEPETLFVCEEMVCEGQREVIEGLDKLLQRAEEMHGDYPEISEDPGNPGE